MRINWLAFNFDPHDGYGKYSSHLVRALNRIGVNVTPLISDQVRLPGWIQHLTGINYSHLTIACLPPYMLWPVAGRQWSLTMTEGTKLPPDWGSTINVRAQRLITPCHHNAEAFESGGVTVPISVVLGGTSPSEFPILKRKENTGVYTFLALADRGARKGWVEVWSAFYAAFGEYANTKDVRLIIKTKGASNELVTRISGACRDPRIRFWAEDIQYMADLYALADCFAIPSRSEGWGMPQREAAMMGIPVIVAKHSGLDDGHTEKWALVVEETTVGKIPDSFPNCGGVWERVDVDAMAAKMRWCYENRSDAAERGQQAAHWLRENQTWEHSARALKALIEEYS